DGRMAFPGPAAEVRAHFGIDHMVTLYARLKEKTAAQRQAAFAAIAPAAAAAPPAAAAGPPAAGTSGGARGWGQLRVLTARYLETLTRDARNAWLLLAQAPLVAALIGLSLLYGQSDIAYTKPKNTILFLLALTAVWFGCSNAVRELVKGRPNYLRERRVNLRLLPYLATKVLVLVALALPQCVLVLVILDLWSGSPGR